MPRYRFVLPALVAPVAAACALAAGVVAPSSATATTTVVRYASPSGTASAKCLKSAPCDIVTAINNAPAGADVVVTPGTYGKSSPISAHLANTRLTLHGETGHPLPVINTSAQVAISLDAGRISHLEFRSSGKEVIASTAPVDHVIAIDTGSGGTACSVNVSLSDSVCAATGSDGIAVNVYIPMPSTGISHLHPSFFGVTAEAPAAGGTGLLLDAGANNIVTLRVTNSILHGGKVDAEAETNAASAVATVVLKHTDSKTTRHAGSNGAPAVSSDSTDIQTKPALVDPGADNFAEKASSATINRGTSATAGDTDVLGHPRWVGSSPDMGAYEFRQPPLIAGLTVTHSTSHTAKMSVNVNPEGLATTVQVIATLGGKQVKSHTVRAGAGRGVTVVHLHLAGLHVRSDYHIVAVATNSGGSARTQKKSLRTGA